MRYGDHQPEFSPHLLDPGLDEAGVGKKLENYDPRYYATYYAIDAINFEPVKSPAVMDTIDAAYLPLVIQEAAGIPLDPVVRGAEEHHAPLQGRVLRLQGRRGSAQRFNRLLIDAGFIKEPLAAGRPRHVQPPSNLERKPNQSGTASRGRPVLCAVPAWSLRCIWRRWRSCCTTEYGPFAITLSLLAWVFVNCLLLLVLPRPGDLPRRWRWP